MRAMTITSGGGLSWERVETPRPRAGEVLLKVEYAAVNRADLMQREGAYPPPQDCPPWPGLEVSGTIAELGENVSAAEWRIGDRVCALLGGGGYAEYAAVPCEMLMPIPPNCTMREAAALPEALATAYLNLFEEGGLKRGDTLLMHAGASGLASIVIPMAKAAGAYVVTTIIDEKKRDAVKNTGADLIVNSRTEDVAAVLRALDARGQPVSLAIDCLGGELMGRCLPYMAYMGKWIVIATLAGDLTQVNLRDLYVRNVRVIGSTLRSKSFAVKADIIKKLVAHTWADVSAGTLRPTVFAELPITQAAEAHRLLYEGKNVGKVVLRVSP